MAPFSFLVVTSGRRNMCGAVKSRRVNFRSADFTPERDKN